MLFNADTIQDCIGNWYVHGESDALKPDYVVDAIDNIDTKILLIKSCHTLGLKIVSSMGSGCKVDPV